MSTFTIKEGKHNHTLWPVSFLPWLRPVPEKVTFTWEVSFDDSCIYDSPAYNAEDVNKLCGISFGWFPKHIDQLGLKDWIAPEHWNSARCGWVWSPKYNAWKLLAYCYAENKKNWDEQMRYPEILKVPRGGKATISITYDPETGDCFFYAEPVDYIKNGIRYIDETGTVAPKGQHLAKLPKGLDLRGWMLGFYFGGGRVTPHIMKASIKQL